jgi:UDP-N-acetylglucosamine diphosphorylase / glucose-1-phosphate thymidylyltransferase / UDP-N-acetylgalactosamine diphosphorylase / glucosamine-1-phosphate N-acetyltransferase / galactosamine-1-phosphate N-acetyltransferase
MPVLLTRSAADFPIGNIPLRQHHGALPDGWQAAENAWIEIKDLEGLAAGSVLEDQDGTTLAWRGGEIGSGPRVVASRSFLIRHSWDLLRANEQHVSGMRESEINGDVHPLAVIEGVVLIGEGTRLLPGVFIEGNVVIGRHCKIGPNCYLRGNTSIGDGCHVGNAVEIKNSILLSKTNVGHLSYVGDSILGERVNFGAGTITSNLRHDGTNHRTLVDGALVDTGRRKFGTIVGDGVHTGIQTTIYPGRKLFPHTSTRPGDVVRDDLTTS